MAFEGFSSFIEENMILWIRRRLRLDQPHMTFLLLWTAAPQAMLGGHEARGDRAAA